MRQLAVPWSPPRALAPAVASSSGFSLQTWGPRLLVLVIVAWLAVPVAGYQNALLVLTLSAFGLAVAGFRYRPLGLIGMSMLCTLDAITRHLLLTTGGLWRWNSFNYWLLLVMAFSAPALLARADVHTRILRLLVILLFVELAFSPDLELGSQQILGVATTFGLQAYFLRSADDDEAWYWQGLLNSLVSGVGSLMYYLVRDRLPYVNANAWAFFPLTGIFAVCLAFPAALRLRRNLNLLSALALLNVAWVFLSGSRGTLFISLACVFYLVMSTPGVVRRFSYVAVALVLLFGASQWFGDLEEHSIHRLTKLFDASESAAGRTSGRSDLGIGGYYMFLEHPFGVGTGGFAANWAKLGARDRLSGFKQGEEFQAHSGWIKILAENGPPGLLLLMAYVASFAFVGRRHADPRLRALAYTVTAALGIAFLSTEFQGKGFWFLAAGVTTALGRAIVLPRPLAARIQLVRAR